MTKRSKISDFADQPKETGKLEAMPTRYFGAHVSIAGGLENVFLDSLKIGGQSLALFLKSQRKWDNPELKEDQVERFRNAAAKHNFNLQKAVPHGSYLINIANPDQEKRQKSYRGFLDDLQRCERLGLGFYNLHPGSTVGECTIKESIAFIADCVNKAHSETRFVKILLETMAGQGHTIGNRFEELRDIIALVDNKARIGVCIDTCHIFAAGYDIRTQKAFEKTFSEFDSIVGLDFIMAFHLNDSKGELGCKKDRHENIGRGAIGLEGFKLLVNDERFRSIPMILETPGGLETYRNEISLLMGLVQK